MQMFLTPPTQTTEMGAIHPTQQTGLSSNTESPESFALVFEECQKQLSPTPTVASSPSDPAASEALPPIATETAPPLFIQDTVQTLLLNLQTLPTSAPIVNGGSPSVVDSAPNAPAAELSAGTPSLSLPVSGMSLPFENPPEPTPAQTSEQTETEPAPTDVTMTKGAETVAVNTAENHSSSLSAALPVESPFTESGSPPPSDSAATVAEGPAVEPKSSPSAAPTIRENAVTATQIPAANANPEAVTSSRMAMSAISMGAPEAPPADPAPSASAPSTQTPPDSAPEDLPKAESTAQNPMVPADSRHSELSQTAGSPSTAFTEMTATPFSEKPPPSLSSPFQPEGPQPLEQGNSRPNTPELVATQPAATAPADQPEAKPLMFAPHQGPQPLSPDSPLAKPTAPENLPKAPAETAEMRFYPLGERVRLLRQAGQNQMRLNLQPAELGRVSLQIVQKDQDLHLHIFTDTAMAKELLESQMGQLKHALFQQGLQLQQCVIEVHSEPAGQGFDQERPPQDPAYESKQSRPFDWDEADFELDLSDLPLPKPDNHHVNYLA